MADLMVEGIILKIERKDGGEDSEKGPWTQYSFHVQHHDTGEKHYYSTFSTDGAEVKSNKSYKFLYTTAENKRKPEFPYRNIQGHLEEIETPTSAAPAQQSGRGNNDDVFRTKEELRWTEAMHMATHAMGPDDPSEDWKQSLAKLANWYYRMLCQPPEGNTPANQNNASKSSDNATEPATGEHISPEDATSLMNMAATLMGPTGRKWVMDEIKKRWNLTDPQKLTDEQAQIIATQLDGGEEGSNAVDELQSSFDEGGDNAD